MFGLCYSEKNIVQPHHIKTSNVRSNCMGKSNVRSNRLEEMNVQFISEKYNAQSINALFSVHSIKQGQSDIHHNRT